MTVCVQPDGNLRSLYWPRLGYAEQMKEALTGVYIGPAGGGRLLWLDRNGWDVSQRYRDHCNMIETRYSGNGLEISKTAFVDPHFDAFITVYNVSASSAVVKNVALLVYQDPELEETTWGDATFYEPRHDSIIQYRMSTYFAFGAVEKSSSHQCGVDGGSKDARIDCEDGRLENSDAALYKGRRGVDSAFAYHIGDVSVGKPRTLCYITTVSTDRDRALVLLESARSMGAHSLMDRCENHWRTLARKRVGGRGGPFPRLVERSILALLLLCDKETGGIIACPSTDPDYRYVWPRDAFYAALALDRSGYHYEAERFYLWCRAAQGRSGVLHQRYFSSPALIGPAWGPAWGEEIDETASVLWGMVEHQKLTQDRGFLSAVWPFINQAAWYLVSSVDHSGKVKPTMNLWEEKPSRHIYSTATVSAGLKAASYAANELSYASEARRWNNVSELVKKHLLEAFWNGSLERFIRTDEPRDKQVDISSLAISFPFCILPERDPRMVKTARALADSFHFPVGGIGRFPSDTNYGGNPWILSTCWLAIHYSNAGNVAAARKLLDWTANHATGLGLLPEQVDKEKGTALSAVPLAWSHAMFVLASQALA